MATKKIVSRKKPVVSKSLANKTAPKTTPKPSPKKPVIVTHNAVNTGEKRLVQEKAQDLKQLFSHGVVYVAVNIFLIFVNFATTPDKLWFYWVLIGWGIGLAFHWLDVMNYSPFNEKWAEDEAKKILKK